MMLCCLSVFLNGSILFLQRLPAQIEEDLYIQCDEIDDGIYSNDPDFNSKVPDPPEDDVYLMPES